MPTHNQTKVEVPTTTRDFGDSDTATLQEMFPASPIHSGQLTDAVVLDLGNNLLIGPEVNDGGHTFGVYNRDFQGAPNMADVETGGEGLPGSPYTPAPGSPGPGSVNPADIPAPPSNFPPPPGVEWGSGDSLVSPHESSPEIASKTIGDYMFGRSRS